MLFADFIERSLYFLLPGVANWCTVAATVLPAILLSAIPNDDLRGCRTLSCEQAVLATCLDILEMSKECLETTYALLALAFSLVDTVVLSKQVQVDQGLREALTNDTVRKGQTPISCSPVVLRR
jgi:hypothetical protein